MRSTVTALEPALYGSGPSPGRKDARKLKAFLAEARRAAPQPYLGDDELPYDWQEDEDR